MHLQMQCTDAQKKVRECLLMLHPYMSLWTFSRARAAKPMFFRTSVLVCEFSKASRWNSMVDSVPSIWTSCCSRRFFFFKARRAADAGKSPNNTFITIWCRASGVGRSQTTNPTVVVVVFNAKEEVFKIWSILFVTNLLYRMSWNNKQGRSWLLGGGPFHFWILKTRCRR